MYRCPIEGVWMDAVYTKYVSDPASEGMLWLSPPIPYVQPVTVITMIHKLKLGIWRPLNPGEKAHVLIRLRSLTDQGTVKRQLETPPDIDCTSDDPVDDKLAYYNSPKRRRLERMEAKKKQCNGPLLESDEDQDADAEDITDTLPGQILGTTPGFTKLLPIATVDGERFANARVNNPVSLTQCRDLQCQPFVMSPTNPFCVNNGAHPLNPTNPSSYSCPVECNMIQAGANPSKAHLSDTSDASTIRVKEEPCDASSSSPSIGTVNSPPTMRVIPNSKAMMPLSKSSTEDSSGQSNDTLPINSEVPYLRLGPTGVYYSQRGLTGSRRVCQRCGKEGHEAPECIALTPLLNRGAGSAPLLHRVPRIEESDKNFLPVIPYRTYRELKMNLNDSSSSETSDPIRVPHIRRRANGIDEYSPFPTPGP